MVTSLSVVHILRSAVTIFPLFVKFTISSCLLHIEFKTFAVVHRIANSFTLVNCLALVGFEISSDNATFDMLVGWNAALTHVWSTVVTISIFLSDMVESNTFITTSWSLVRSLITIFIKVIWIMMMMYVWVTSIFVNPFGKMGTLQCGSSVLILNLIFWHHIPWNLVWILWIIWLSKRFLSHSWLTKLGSDMLFRPLQTLHGRFNITVKRWFIVDWTSCSQIVLHNGININFGKQLSAMSDWPGNWVWWCLW